MVNRISQQSETADSGESLRESIATWTKVGFLSFGGPAAQISLMHRIVVEEKHWLTERQFLNGLNFCMLLPGPEAMQLATYTGWRLHGKLGGLVAGLLFVLPGASIMLALAMVYAWFGSLQIVAALFLGIKSSVLVLVVQALVRITNRSLQLKIHWLVAVLAFAGIFFLSIPYPIIVIVAALVGFAIGTDSEMKGSESASNTDSMKVGAVMPTVVSLLVIWWLPLLLLAWIGGQTMLVEIGTFFSKLAIVTFGGAYAVLAYMAQDVVGQHEWLTAAEMMDGLGLAETTPGPLILVTEFVGFLSAFRAGGLLLGLAGAVVTLWVTFVPCFLWIFAGAPYIDWICSRPRLKGAMAAITAAVVGVMLNLSIWFALHVLFKKVTVESYGPITLQQPALELFDWRAGLLFLVSGLLLLYFRLGVVTLLSLSSVLGAALVYLAGY